MRRCSPSTRLYGLIGSPVSHSLSPAIHCEVYRRAGVDAVYLAWETPLERLEERLEALRSLAHGFNVTTPLKEAVLSLLDRVEAEAAEIGAVNTVRNEDGELVGYNTDYLGVAECLRGSRPRVALVIGAGGAARAAVYALYRLGAEKVYIANRGAERARRLAGWAGRLGLDATPTPLEEAAVPAAHADTVVNATPLGSLACCPDQAPPVLEGLREGQLVFDMVYRPLETRLLRAARERGARTVDGLCMLVWQALHADRIWLGIEPTRELYETARKAALEALASS
ncbi:hypothetical protein CF15_06810 [Pyrodictium occultum]|uniref:Shikimate dehydrogenase (NADP(+)) n=1 Tax=Pyrodictium occultum TaxID=2309 RepID=A0A0V8RWL0_PYROC|nr:shikimate dehydrogenase [Pyrodictium occultum]KSW12431.1 hypothetical protein CF15_06810 [Pyrodictium occultum]